MKQRKFDTIELNQTVTFEENGMIETGVVCQVKENIFILRALQSWNNNGVIRYYDVFFSFFKTGTKSNYRYTYGNAIEITGKV